MGERGEPERAAKFGLETRKGKRTRAWKKMYRGGENERRCCGKALKEKSAREGEFNEAV